MLVPAAAAVVPVGYQVARHEVLAEARDRTRQPMGL
jgi:hypothetical protein